MRLEKLNDPNLTVLDQVMAEIETEAFFVGFSLNANTIWLDLMFRGLSADDKRWLAYPQYA